MIWALLISGLAGVAAAAIQEARLRARDTRLAELHAELAEARDAIADADHDVAVVAAELEDSRDRATERIKLLQGRLERARTRADACLEDATPAELRADAERVLSGR